MTRWSSFFIKKNVSVKELRTQWFTRTGENNLITLNLKWKKFNGREKEKKKGKHVQIFEGKEKIGC